MGLKAACKRSMDLFCAFIVWLLIRSTPDHRVDAIAIPSMVKISCPFAFFQFATITLSTSKNCFICATLFLILALDILLILRQQLESVLSLPDWYYIFC